MNVKKSLENRVRGWLPKEPNIVKFQRLENSKVFHSRNNASTIIPAGLFLAFAIFGIIHSVSNSFELNYLPVNFQVFISAVSLADYVCMLVIGAGLLTAKRFWIDTAIVFSVLSLIVFYVVPLRVAIPMEIVAIVSLVYARSFPAKQALTKLSIVAMIAIICVAFFAPLAIVNSQLTNSKETVVARSGQASNNRDFVANITVFQEPDADNQKDYYLIQVVVHCIDRERNYLNVSLGFSPEAAILIAYRTTPQTNPASPIEIGLGASTLLLGNYRTVLAYSSNTSIRWIERTINPEQDEWFSAELWVPQSSHFNLNLSVEARLEDKIFGNLWVDNLSLARVEV